MVKILKGVRVVELGTYITGPACGMHLADLGADVIKADRNLIIDVDQNERRQAIMEGLVTLTDRLGIRLIAEGVETFAEASWLYQRGITLQQGYLFARPAIETLSPCPSDLIGQIRASAYPARYLSRCRLDDRRQLSQGTAAQFAPLIIQHASLSGAHVRPAVTLALGDIYHRCGNLF